MHASFRDLNSVVNWKKLNRFLETWFGLAIQYLILYLIL